MAATRRPARAAPKWRSKTYIPYNVAMQRARDKMKPKAPYTPYTACLHRRRQLLVAKLDSTVLALCGHWKSGVVRER